MSIKLTVLFEGSFWVGVFEKEEDGNLKTSRVVFGAQPKDYEVLRYIANEYYKLIFSMGVKVEKNVHVNNNYKRVQRLVRKEIRCRGIGTKAQQAIKMEQERQKSCTRLLSKREQELDEKRKFALKQKKKKEKQRGH